MKALAVFALVFGAVQVGAVGPDQEPGSPVYYQSWCEGDVVKGETEDGGVEALFDCYESSGDDDRLTCVERARKVGNKTIISATCQ